MVRNAKIYTPPCPGHRLPSSNTARAAGTRKVTMPSTHIGIAVQPPAAITDDPVIQQIIKTYVAVSPKVPSTFGRIRSGTSSVVIRASRPDGGAASSSWVLSFSSHALWSGDDLSVFHPDDTARFLLPRRVVR